MKTKSINFKHILWLPILLSTLGLCAYFGQAWVYTHQLESNLDEGAYLYKGYLFVTGQYKIYQAYGPWSNHMPLSFLIPGYIQLVFGPGLDTGRYFMLALAFCTLAGIWVLSRRLGGEWWATASIWLLAINPVLIKMYSLAVSQGLIACMLVWSLVLTIGPGRTIREIGVGSLLASLMVLTRINMIPALPLLAVYILWQHGWKSGWLAILIMVVVQASFYVYYWPGILTVWARFVPPKFFPILSYWAKPGDAIPYWNPTTPWENKWLTIFRTIRYHFVFMVGAIASWLVWPLKDKLEQEGKYKSFIFLSGLLISLVIAHTWATLTQGYCVFCLEGYLAFFSFLGWLVLVTSFSSWRKELVWYQQMIIYTVILVLAAGIGYAAFEDFRQGILNLILNISIPRFLIGFTQGATRLVNLRAILENKFYLDNRMFRRFDPMITGLALGLVILFLAFIARIVIRYRLSKHGKEVAPHTTSLAYYSLVFLLLIGVLLTPTRYLGGGKINYDCSGNVFRTYREAGEYLAKVIPEHSSIYWKGGLSVVPLLYIRNIRIFPPQINADYSYFRGGKSDELLRLGLWNEALNEQWINSADFLLIEARYYRGNLKEEIKNSLKLKQLIELPATPEQVTCRPASQIRVFQRVH